jgi:TorA maturation chaperone TorD
MFNDDWMRERGFEELKKAEDDKDHIASLMLLVRRKLVHDRKNA